MVYFGRYLSSLTLVLGLFNASTAQELTVFAASSLTEAFQEIASVFKWQNEGTEVLFNFGGSSTLATQIVRGAPADVFASADETQMQVVEDDGLTVSEPQIFTSNRLVLITAEDSGITSLEQLGEPGVLLVLAGPDVPIGRYAREALTKMNEGYGADFSARVLENLVSEESNVRQVALKVELGEADAAIVYETDAAVAEGVTTLAIPDDLNVLGAYPVVALADSSQLELAGAFIELLLSEKGQAVLAARGFGAPE